MRSAFRAGILAGAVAAMGAFSSTSGAQDVQCPMTGVLERAGSVTKFSGGSDPSAMTLEARITDLTANCRVDDAGNGVVDLRLGLQAIRGPAAAGEDFPVTYFIAILSPSEEVLSRQAFSVDFRIPADRNGARTTEELALRIPRPNGAPLGQYRVYVAMQLSAGELDYNRRATGG